MNTENNQQPVLEQPKILLKEEQDRLHKWYDQQIAFAKKKSQLAQYHAEVAEHRFKEQLAYAKIAQLAGPLQQEPGQDEEKKGESQAEINLDTQTQED
jgi:hypothetical protein